MDLFNSFNKNYLILYGHEVDKFNKKTPTFLSARVYIIKYQLFF
tara:strand:- start:54 stop:185 length:132 start_codon:yes stop_codon:yes gene_type:complete